MTTAQYATIHADLICAIVMLACILAVCVVTAVCILTRH